MKLRKAHIHNFRGILDQEISLKDYSLLVGPNNSGKSTVIDAIRAFYEKDGFKFRQESDFPYGGTSDQESWVELTFSLSDDEYRSLADIYKNPASKELKVRKYFRTDATQKDGKSRAGFIFGYRSDGVIHDEPFYGAKNVQSGKFGDLVYIPAISKVEEHAKLSGPSALRDLLNDIMSDVVQSGKAYGEFSAALKAFADTIRGERTSDGRSLSGLEEELNALLRPWQVQFKLNFPAPCAPDIVKSMTRWDLIDQVYAKAQDIDLFGSGFQRYFIYSLIRLGSRYAGKKSTKKAKDFTPTLSLVLFEEPEAFLHPPQQGELARSLRQLASTENWQVVCATHSAQFVSRNAADVPAITRLRRSNGEIQSFQINDSDWQSLIDANQVINSMAKKYPKLASKLDEDDLSPDMEALKYFIWLNPDRASAVFADHVLLVEGPTEVALINRLIADEKIRNTPPGLYVMDCLGKCNIHRFMNLFSQLGIPHSVVHDEDCEQEWHAEVNKLIEECRHPEFTVEIQRISGRLEELLEISAPRSPHRKPQHVLYHYEKGRIPQEKLDQFCQLLEQCFSSNVVPNCMERGAST
ncbi:MAG: hypothetical protein KatS3mg082_3063 [Nitrospiraceae bacterium]|nr:MAG: hypothetical protein KatS3mg082_3063 [Nitrospiraceae bacterium]